MANTDLLESIRSNVIGERMAFDTPFGTKPMVYADYTASGRSLKHIEDFISNQVLPFYANTHTETSATGKQTTAFREQARQVIKESVHADDQYALIFTGSGATSAINKLIDILNLRIPAELGNCYQLDQYIPENERPVVFVGPYEHHSNELPWRESIADLVEIPLDQSGLLDLNALELSLKKYQHRAVKIGSFSAASNVTGIKTDVDAVSVLLHQYGALSFWDYAASGPYVDIHVANSDAHADNSLDAVFLSPHKFIGGPGTPGVLILKRSLLTNRVPAMPGGGTVSWVSKNQHHYLEAGERKEEGGTPAIVESIRAGLVFQLKDRVGSTNIESLEHGLIQKAMTRLSADPNIEILGGTSAERISIMSFHIRCGERYLHHGLLVAALNDLFGIQVRGGCSCAGPYGHYLLGISETDSTRIVEAIRQGQSILKPGWVRLNFNYFLDEETFDYLLSAIELLSEYGWKLLSEYQFDAEQGVWHTGSEAKTEIKSLNACFDHPAESPTRIDRPLSEYLSEARARLEAIEPKLIDPVAKLDAQYEDLRWYTTLSDLNRAEGQTA